MNELVFDESISRTASVGTIVVVGTDERLSSNTAAKACAGMIKTKEKAGNYVAYVELPVAILTFC